VIYEYNARLTRVVDGDTVWLDVDLGFGVHTNADFRLFGIDTPEVIGTTRVAGLAAKVELERLLALGTLRIQTHKGDESDKYGRWLADLFVRQGDGTELHVNGRLVSGGFAKAYFGKGPK
jgi:micrococcal nuclease